MPPHRRAFVLLEFRDANGQFNYRAYMSAVAADPADFSRQVYEHIGYVPNDQEPYEAPEGRLFSVTVRPCRVPGPLDQAAYFITGAHGVHRFGAAVPYRQEDIVALLGPGQQVREVPFEVLAV